ncbi:MAG: hypothetical protein WD995_00330 [Gemmatimonadota bacterium]
MNRVQTISTKGSPASTWLLAAVLVLAMPGGSAAQEDPAARLAGRLPADIEATVLDRIQRAQQMQLPSGPLTDLVLQGVAKGRSGSEVLAALDGLTVGLGIARDALARSGAAPSVEEVEAAGMAMRMGVDAESVAGLARSRPEGRSLSVPLLVLGGLTQRGLPSDQALSQVVERLAARMDDAGLLADLSGPAGAPGLERGPPIEPPAGPFGPGGQGAPGVGNPGAGPPFPVGPSGGGRPSGTPADGRPGAGGPPPTPPGPGGS